MKLNFTIDYKAEWGQTVCICGSTNTFGCWNEEIAVPMHCVGTSTWILSVDLDENVTSIQYRFLIKENERIIRWEWGSPHSCTIESLEDIDVSCFWKDNPVGERIAGVAIPVFSLRSNDSWGIGEFLDLKKMIDWAVSTGQKIIQILPINDTTSSCTWKDSYPYNSISVYALHPLYLSLENFVLRNNELNAYYREEARRLNNLPSVDYEQVSRLKWAYISDLYSEIGESFSGKEDYRNFMDRNNYWLFPYACFSFLRDKFHTSNTKCWDEYSEYNKDKLERLIESDEVIRDSIGLYCFIQYLLDKQLSEVKEYARQKGVLLKGDIPIGVNKNSVEVWTEPYLFNIDSQTGAPPDDFSIDGQNWGFPTYNWNEMARDNYRWWTNRFEKMSAYFDAYRIDHILGFFRIWEIPTSSVQGMLGYFSPANPLSEEEIRARGFALCAEEMTKARIRYDHIDEHFGEVSCEAIEKFLYKIDDTYFALREEYHTQRKIQAFFSERDDERSQDLCRKLYGVCNEVLFIRDKYDPTRFHPRISAYRSFAYQDLDVNQQEVFTALYEDFFYHRHSDFWGEQAMSKLPVLISSSSMLPCGEDLGMIPSCVPDVMEKLRILSLEIERMPKEFGVLFESLSSIPEMSVCTTSTHDMNPIRAWWLENREITQRYYNEVLWKEGVAPQECTSDLCWQILTNHLNSPAKLCIIPLQDWLSFYDDLKNTDANAERINIPSDPDHYWRYRMHLTLETLINATHYNVAVRKMICESKRL